MLRYIFILPIYTMWYKHLIKINQIILSVTGADPLNFDKEKGTTDQILGSYKILNNEK